MLAKVRRSFARPRSLTLWVLLWLLALRAVMPASHLMQGTEHREHARALMPASHLMQDAEHREHAPALMQGAEHREHARTAQTHHPHHATHSTASASEHPSVHGAHQHHAGHGHDATAPAPTAPPSASPATSASATSTDDLEQLIAHLQHGGPLCDFCAVPSAAPFRSTIAFGSLHAERHTLAAVSLATVYPARRYHPALARAPPSVLV